VIAIPVVTEVHGHLGDSKLAISPPREHLAVSWPVAGSWKTPASSFAILQLTAPKHAVDWMVGESQRI
jgi:hypothetical protein